MGSISIDQLRFGYRDATAVACQIDSLNIVDGDFVLVVGPSGSGKSTMLRSINGIVPHLTGGRFAGTVIAAGRNTRDAEPRHFADAVGFVHQDPESQFVVDHVESDIAYVLENLDHDPMAMRRRVEEVLDALGIAHLRDRSPGTLSGGERQRCAIAGALAAAPSVLVLDEPTSQLDPQGAEDVLTALARLNADLGTTIVIAEHRLDRVAPLAERAVRFDAGAMVDDNDVRSVLRDYSGAPVVTQLGRLFSWDPLPLTVKQARVHARDLTPAAPAPTAAAPGRTRIRATDVQVRVGGRTTLRVDDLALQEGEIVALLGRNGAGKTTLLRALGGLQSVAQGRVNRDDRVAYVPQEPGALFSRATVAENVMETLRLLGQRSSAANQGLVAQWLDQLHLTDLAERHPRSLSGGERQRCAIAIVAVGGAPTLLLDEPTRGMDAASRAALEHALITHASTGGTVVLATHDVELAARVAHRVVVLGDGEVVADGDARTVLSGSLFAPQTLRTMPPLLTVDEARAWNKR